MTYKLSSGRRYLNGELVDSPQLGPWKTADLFPEFNGDEFCDAGLYEIEMDADDWAEVEDWLLAIEASDAPLQFMIEQCFGRTEPLPEDIRETRLKDFPAPWISAYWHAIKSIPEGYADSLCLVVAKAVRAERERRIAAPVREPETRSTLTFFRPG